MMMNKIKVSILGILFIGLFQINCNKASKYQQKDGRIIVENWYDKSKLKSRIWYNNGKKDSLGLWFYENGETQVKAELKDGKHVGQTFYFYPDGKLKSYVFYDDEGGAIYKKDYDEDGLFQKEEGIPFSIIFNNDLIIDNNDFFSFFVKTATPPYSEITILTGKKDGKPDFFIDQVYNVKNKRIPLFKYYFNNLGKQEIMVVSILKDTVQNTVERDTVSFTISVEE